ncbi:bifunctional DNA-formamidopyrimidine glycosylase/DNA-(apurinic or apyrimidinic site) lyase [Patescibacteria group bacterium]|nr:bifunctional DNA-formamidopyrimidine glycosylase/DNA-(apurinic or apyrimidinic site) lyase [Patescibacteria group bacterium]
MPELPEVETIRRGLEKYLVGSPRRVKSRPRPRGLRDGGALRGHKITKVEVRWRKSLPKDEGKLVGGKVEKIRRFGKVLSIDLDNGYSAVIHIKLTGQLIYRGPNLKFPSQLSKKVVGGVPGLPAKASKMRAGKHTHVIFNLDRGGKLYYNDVRKFGWIKVVKTSEVRNIDFIKKLGPEPFDGLTLKKFREIVSSTKRAIKVLLMDQSKISGVGNIYASDALWLAGVNPRKEAKKLRNEEIKKLYEAILKVLKEGLKRGGASELSFVTPDGKEGTYQEHFLAYGRKDEPCGRCHKAKFKKIKLGGRGTYYCPVCQK